MRLGISSWSYFGDNNPDSPSGANFYMSSIILECKKRGWEVFWMQPNRDAEFAEVKFENFLPKERKEAYEYTKFVHELAIPVLDILLIEWRWPIEGRNFGTCIEDNYTPDLKIQRQLLDMYKDTGTKIVVWDQDYKIANDAFELLYKIKAKIIETSVIPMSQRHRCHVPFDFSLFSHVDLHGDTRDEIVYIGNNYERSEKHIDIVDAAADLIPTSFYGNWLKYNNDCLSKYASIEFKKRLTKAEFGHAMSTALLVPLLAKKEYFEHGFMTARILEALYFGALPVGFRDFNGIEFYVIPELIISNKKELVELYDRINGDIQLYRDLWHTQVTKLEFMHVKHFIDLLERI